jgi:hypothetical protein
MEMPIRQNLSALARAGAAFCGRRAEASGAALLVFAALLFAAATPSAAATYTLAYSGTATATAGIFAQFGIVAGDPVSGTLTFDPLHESPNDPVTTNPENVFSQASTAFTFHMSHSGGVALTQADSGTGIVTSSGITTVDPGLFLSGSGVYSTLELQFHIDPATGGAALASLAGLPNSPSGLIALLAGTSPHALGIFSVPGFGSVQFNIADAVATTPIPAALPLLASALGGLGFAAWRRRKANAGTDALSA